MGRKFVWTCDNSSCTGGSRNVSTEEGGIEVAIHPTEVTVSNDRPGKPDGWIGVKAKNGQSKEKHVCCLRCAVVILERLGTIHWIEVQ